MSQVSTTAVPGHADANAETDLDDELTAGFTHKFIRHKSRQLIGRHGVTAGDRSDLEQDMKLRLLRRLPQFDPSKSDWPSFVTTVVERHVATIIQSRRRLKRAAAGGLVSLAQEALNEEGERVEQADCVLLEDVERVTGEMDRSQQDWLELELDCESVLAGLPLELHEICRLLKFKSISAVARQLDIPRTTLVSLLRQLGPAFEKAGLDAFLWSRTSSGAEPKFNDGAHDRQDDFENLVK